MEVALKGGELLVRVQRHDLDPAQRIIVDYSESITEEIEVNRYIYLH